MVREKEGEGGKGGEGEGGRARRGLAFTLARPSVTEKASDVGEA